jgi:HEAT repeat protein
VAGSLRLSQHAAALRAALSSDDDELVAAAARGVGLIGDVKAFDRLIELMGESDRAWFVRLAAAGALGAIGDPRATPALERELFGDNWTLQSRAATSLRLLGRQGETALRSALGSHTETVRAHARVALES